MTQRTETAQDQQPNATRSDVALSNATRSDAARSDAALEVTESAQAEADATQGEAAQGQQPNAARSDAAQSQQPGETRSNAAQSEAESKQQSASASDELADAALADDYATQAQDAISSLPIVRVEASYCHRAKGSECTRCSVCCPHDAITLSSNDAPTVNASACRACGICAGVCDAFMLKDVNLHQLHRQILRIAITGRRVYLACKKNVPQNYRPDRRTIVLPCLSMLSPAFFTMILAEGVELAVACKLESCEGCELGGQIGGLLFPRAIEIAQERTDAQVKIVTKIPKEATLEERLAPEDDPLGRRQAFQGLATDLLEIASGKRRITNSNVLQDYYIKKQQNRIHDGLSIPKGAEIDARSTAKNRKGILFPQYRMLATAAMAKPQAAPKIGLAISRTDEEACCNSLQCAHSCPTGARFKGTDGKLAFDSMLCIGCGICVESCPHCACSIETGTAEEYLKA